MSLELIGFIVLSVGLLTTAGVVIVARNPIHSALSLIASFFFLAAIYLTLNANFVAVIQVLVYAGAIMVLFLFVIMLLNLSDEELGAARWNLHKVLGTAATLLLTGVLIWAIASAERNYLTEPASSRSGAIAQLRANASDHTFPTMEARTGFYEDLARLHIMAIDKVRLERGTPAARIDACEDVAALTPTLSPDRCQTQPGQVAARGIAAAALADFDKQLLALQSVIDGSPVPANWKGADAKRVPGLNPTRREQAVISVADIIFGNKLDALIDVQASTLLDKDGQAEIAAFAPAHPDQTASATQTPRELRGLTARLPRGRIEVARQRADLLEELAGDADLTEFLEARAALHTHYLAVVADVLRAMREDRTDAVVSTLAGASRDSGVRLTSFERSMVQDVLTNISARSARLAVVKTPAIYDESDFGSVEAVGRQLFTTFLLPFEVTSVLLLVGILGAVVIAKRRV